LWKFTSDVNKAWRVKTKTKAKTSAGKTKTQAKTSADKAKTHLPGGSRPGQGQGLKKLALR